MHLFIKEAINSPVSLKYDKLTKSVFLEHPDKIGKNSSLIILFEIISYPK